MCEQLAQGCYSAVWRLGFEPVTALTTRLPSYTGSFHDNLAMPVRDCHTILGITAAGDGCDNGDNQNPETCRSSLEALQWCTI